LPESHTRAPFPKFVIHPSILTRTSETKGHEQVFDSGAAYRFEVPETGLWQMVQELQIGGTGSGK
jgi:hypothetical protein